MPREYVAPDPATLRWVAREVHPRARVRDVRRLIGGITADMDRIRVEHPDGTRDVVLRRWAGASEAEALVARESDALVMLEGQGLPAPVLLAADPDGSSAGVHCTLTACLDGVPDLTPVDLPSWLTQLAATQAVLHAVPAQPATRWDGWFAADKPRDWLADPGLREAAESAASGPVSTETLFLHGDYQHFNILWRDGRLSGVVDWPNAGAGARGTDVGHCRLNLAVLFGPEAAADYLAAYERSAGVAVELVADLRALLVFDVAWQRFIPRQVAGRAPLDVAGMPARVAATVRATLDRMG